MNSYIKLCSYRLDSYRDDCVAVETCCLDDNYKILYNYWYIISCVLDGNKNTTNNSILIRIGMQTVLILPTRVV